jgi:hypothetical protein
MKFFDDILFLNNKQVSRELIKIKRMNTQIQQGSLNSQNLDIVPLTDLFTDSRPAGQVVGTQGDGRAIRKGIDVEGVIAIDNNALRFQPLITPGWGRQGVVYGPYPRVNGLAFAAFLLNGHNTSQGENIGQGFLGRCWRWLRGSETEPPLVRLWRLLLSPQKKGLFRRFTWWFRSRPRSWQLPNLDENLAVGWFSKEIPEENPLAGGNSFIMHAARGDNGELWAQVGVHPLSAFNGLQNIPTYYIVILRDRGSAYYAASIPNAHKLIAYPNMRPIAIDPVNEESPVYAGVYQSVLGQIGFRVDTRVYGVRIDRIPQFSTWYGTAHAADTLVGYGLLHNAAAEVGGAWTTYAGNYKLTERGAQPTGINNLAILFPDSPNGLVHILLETCAQPIDVSLIWRFQDLDNFWELRLTDRGCYLQTKQTGVLEFIATDEVHYLHADSVHSIQILDDGKIFSLYLNGKTLFEGQFIDNRLQRATGVGIGIVNSPFSGYFRSIEAHPRSIPIPAELDLGCPWIVKGQQIVVTDDFERSMADLKGKRTSTGNRVWRKEIGKGKFVLTGHGSVRVKASVQCPNPGRTAYTIGWDNPEFADVMVTITPPGTERNQKECGRGGLIFWQDANNYLTITTYLDDDYGGASIALFSYLNGYEELYDAVWTMVGTRVYWGIPYRLRIAFDGNQMTAYLDDEPVLYRALTDIYPEVPRFRINRIGLVANWEWGNDTGSQFSNFIAQV